MVDAVASSIQEEVPAVFRGEVHGKSRKPRPGDHLWFPETTIGGIEYPEFCGIVTNVSESHDEIEERKRRKIFCLFCARARLSVVRRPSHG